MQKIEEKVISTEDILSSTVFIFSISSLFFLLRFLLLLFNIIVLLLFCPMSTPNQRASSPSAVLVATVSSSPQSSFIIVNVFLHLTPSAYHHHNHPLSRVSQRGTFLQLNILLIPCPIFKYFFFHGCWANLFMPCHLSL